MITEIFFLFFGALVLGAYGGMMGQGAGILGLPFLVEIFHKEFAVARATCLLLNVSLSSAAIKRHIREGRSFEGALPVCIGMILGVLGGVVIKSYVTERDLWLLYSVFLVIVLVSFFLKKGLKNSVHEPMRLGPAFLVGLFGGIFCGSLGVGGGAFMVPGLAILAKVPLKRCLILSNMTIIFGSLLGLTFSWASEALFISLIMVPGTILGGYVGANWGQKLPEKVIKTMFCLVILVVLVKVLMRIGMI